MKLSWSSACLEDPQPYMNQTQWYMLTIPEVRRKRQVITCPIYLGLYSDYETRMRYKRPYQKQTAKQYINLPF